MTEPDPVRVEVGRVARIVLARPEKQNAMTPDMGAGVARAVSLLNASDDVRLVLVEGEGKAFCAGGDFDLIRRNSERTPEQNRLGMIDFYRSYLSILRLRAPSLAVVHGAAVGAGLAFALACDLRLAAREAKLGANFVRVGLHPGMGCSVLLPRLVGPTVAAELLLTGRLVSGDDAAALGLVNRAVPRAELAGAVEQLTGELLAVAPVAAAQTKRTLLRPLLRELDEALAHEAAAQAVDFRTADLREAVAAFQAGRSPAFQGR